MKYNFVKRVTVFWILSMFGLIVIPTQFLNAAEESEDVIEEVIVTGSFI